MDRSMIDDLSEGSLVYKTPNEVGNLIANMVANSQQFGVRLDQLVKKVNEVTVVEVLDKKNYRLDFSFQINSYGAITTS